MLLNLFLACAGFETVEKNDTQESEMFEETDPIQPFSKLYLLSRDLGEDGRIYRLNKNDLTAVDLGAIDCNFDDEHDYLAALTSDPKGMLWALSKRHGIYRVHPQEMSCSYSGISARSELFQADSLAFHEKDGIQRFYLAGYYSAGDASYSTALAYLEAGEIVHFGGISNFEGQGNVMDLAAVTDGRLYGLRSWGNHSELAQYSTSTAAQLRQFRIPADNGDAFSFLIDAQEAWLFTATNPQEGSQLHQYDLNEEQITDSIDLSMTVVGAAGLY